MITTSTPGTSTPNMPLSVSFTFTDLARRAGGGAHVPEYKKAFLALKEDVAARLRRGTWRVDIAFTPHNPAAEAPPPFTVSFTELQRRLIMRPELRAGLGELLLTMADKFTDYLDEHVSPEGTWTVSLSFEEDR